MRLSGVLLAFLLIASGSAHAQAVPTASRAGDLQVGAGYTAASADYGTQKINGFAFYSDFDFRAHYGIEFDFHQLNSPSSEASFHERTYEAGGRYLRRYGRSGELKPYAKLLYGRGVFIAPNDQFNLAYNMVVGGAGLDYELTRRVNLRADFEYQRWFSGLGLPNGLTPKLFTLGVAYHFGPGSPRAPR